MNHFDRAFEHVIGVEGGYSNHPDDKGGATKFGITLKRLMLHRGDWSLTTEDVKSLKLDEAKEIYKKWYWDQWQLDAVIDEGIALVLFDQCVNWGTGPYVVKRVQRTLVKLGQKVSVDGIIGPETLAALNRCNGDNFEIEFIFASQDEYIKLFKRQPKYRAFISGWINRTQKLLKEVLGI